MKTGALASETQPSEEPSAGVLEGGRPTPPPTKAAAIAMPPPTHVRGDGSSWRRNHCELQGSVGRSSVPRAASGVGQFFQTAGGRRFHDALVGRQWFWEAPARLITFPRCFFFFVFLKASATAALTASSVRASRASSMSREKRPDDKAIALE
ncbi:hypothetical protein TcBrA4_0016330 [Trypanosoma cruzi]|nr:hypothetical protein TcBrA4_0016330 [Trypanosoma cruzi]